VLVLIGKNNHIPLRLIVDLVLTFTILLDDKAGAHAKIF
jgi:hypothetical protein